MADLNASDLFGGDVVLEKLIEDLESVFPPVNPQPTEPMELIMYRSGQRSVVEYLLQLIDKETNV